jgi:parvulin-like peptidyl-prolyl isomerase
MHVIRPLILTTFLAMSVAPCFGQNAETADPAPTASDLNPVILTVNGEPIHAFEISMIMQTVQAQLEQRGDEIEPSELAKMATQRAIEQKLLVQEARRFGIEADELEVQRAARATEQRAGGRTMLEAKLKATGSSYEEFLEVVRELEMMQLFVTRQIVPNVEVTNEEIETFYADNPEAFRVGDRVHAYHMVFTVNENADAETQSRVRARAEAARQRALTGEEDFTTVARELSDGPSAPEGGDLGWVERGTLVGPLSDAVFALEPGGISPVVQTKFGFHVATISERRSAGTVSLEEASGQIESLLRQQKAANTVGELLETLVESAEVVNQLGTGVPGFTGGLD